MFRLAKLSLANRALIALITVFASRFRRDHDVLAEAGAHPLHRVPADHRDLLDARRVAGSRGQADQRPAGKGAEQRRGAGVDVVNVPQRRLADHPGVHLRLQPGPGPEPDRPRHLQRQAGPAEGRPAAGDRREHQRLPDRVPGRVLGQTAQRTQRRSRPAQRPPAAEARRRARRRRDRRRHAAHPDPAAAPGPGGIGREPPVHQRRAEEQRCIGPGRHHRGTGQDPLAADRQPGGLPRRHQGPPPGRGPRCGDDRQRGGRQPGRGRPHLDHADQRQGNPRPVRDQEARGRHRRDLPRGQGRHPAARGRARLQRQVHPGLRPGAVHREVDQGPHHRGPAGAGLRRRW